MKAAKDRVGIIGLGRMGRCLAQGMVAAGYQPEQIAFTTKHEESAKRAVEGLPIHHCSSNKVLLEQCETIVLAVKPQNAPEVLDEIKKFVTKNHTVISIVASISTSEIGDKLARGVPIIRAMPNTPAFVRAGMTAVCLGAHAGDKDWVRAEKLFKPVGRVVRVDEKHMDAVTGLSGCGPAYIYMILESLTDGGIKVGLPRELATQLAAQTVLGAAQMLMETGRHPAALKDEVTTPAGCTIDGLLALEEGKLRVTLIKAVVQATERAKSLAHGGKN